MKERPILFSAPMVRAILDNSKSQTRRVIKPQPIVGVGGYLDWKDASMDPLMLASYCPYGKVGDRLYVRETFGLFNHYGAEISTEEARTRPTKRSVVYRASEPYQYRDVFYELVNLWEDDITWKPSIFMPRWASRLTLEITDVRVQRLQEIDRADAAAEGICYLSKIGWNGVVDGLNIIQKHHWPEENFSRLWDSINGKSYPWESNPFVWALAFKVINP